MSHPPTTAGKLSQISGWLRIAAGHGNDPKPVNPGLLRDWARTLEKMGHQSAPKEADMSNCITDSKSRAPDVRVLQIAAWCQETAGKRPGMIYIHSQILHNVAEQLRDIAADIRAAQPDPRASMEPKLDDTADQIVSMLHAAGSMSLTEVDAVWADAADNILNLSDPDRIRCIIAWINASIRAGQGGK